MRNPRPTFGLAMAPVALALACGLLSSAAPDAPVKAVDPAKVTRDALKGAELACLGCAFPDLPKDARAACAKLDPVCKALAGMCEDPDAGK